MPVAVTLNTAVSLTNTVWLCGGTVIEGAMGVTNSTTAALSWLDGPSFHMPGEASFGARMPIEKRHALKALYPDAEHPVVRTHPETGEKVLFVNSFTTHFTNFHTPENVRYGHDYSPGGAQLLNYLIARATIPEYQVRWRWRPNSVAIWDNRSTQHYAVMDYWPAVRKMERAGIIGDLPY